MDREKKQFDRRRVLKIAGAGITGGIALSGAAGARRGRLQRELARVIGATARYANVQAALDDGFVPTDEFVCGMGYHYMNPARVDGSLSIAEPELLVYGENPNGKLTLGAVEYAVPTAVQSSRPDLFSDEGADVRTPEEEGWHVLHTPQADLWTLHAWVHRHNPEGVFHHTNPTDPFVTDHEGNCLGH